MNKLSVKPSSGNPSMQSVTQQYYPVMDRINNKLKQTHQDRFDANTRAFSGILDRIGMQSPPRTKESMMNKLLPKTADAAQDRLRELSRLSAHPGIASQIQTVEAPMARATGKNQNPSNTLKGANKLVARPALRPAR